MQSLSQKALYLLKQNTSILPAFRDLLPCGFLLICFTSIDFIVYLQPSLIVITYPSPREQADSGRNPKYN